MLRAPARYPVPASATAPHRPLVVALPLLTAIGVPPPGAPVVADAAVPRSPPARCDSLAASPAHPFAQERPRSHSLPAGTPDPLYDRTVASLLPAPASSLPPVPPLPDTVPLARLLALADPARRGLPPAHWQWLLQWAHCSLPALGA